MDSTGPTDKGNLVLFVEQDKNMPTQIGTYLIPLLHKEKPKPEKGIGKKLQEAIGCIECQKQMPQYKYQSCCNQQGDTNRDDGLA